MKRTLVFFAVLLIALGAFAQNVPETNPNTHTFPIRGWARPGGGGGSNLIYHTGGAVIQLAHVVFIFWGPTFNDPTSSDFNYAKQLILFRNGFGSTGEYHVITQYYQNLGSGNQFVQSNPLQGTQVDQFDTSTPPQNVTDAIVQGEVSKYIAANGFDASAVYEVLIPASSYSSNGTSTSCGGPSLAYCAYHGHFSSGANDVKYAIGPYPGCSGCQSAGFQDYQNAEHFICHETREAVTDPDLNAWFDRRGNEADDKCAWSPAPFIDPVTGFAYQYEWSNSAGGCVQTQ
jgi:hypothetical protein